MRKISIGGRVKMIKPEDKAVITNLKTIRDKLDAELELAIAKLDCTDESNIYNQFINLKKKYLIKDFDTFIECIKITKNK